jgi:hypothetical protein
MGIVAKEKEYKKTKIAKKKKSRTSSRFFYI